MTTSQYGGRDNTPWQLGVGSSQDEVIHNLNHGISAGLGANQVKGGRHHASYDIALSESNVYQRFGGMVRQETSPQSKKVSHGENWNLSPISSQLY